MTRLYPVAEPYESGLLDVGGGHRLYWETVGRPGGVPAVWLHGGPGSGAKTDSRRLFDPAGYRAVLFDQRGCGRSLPLADHASVDLSGNTTAHLLRDIEALRTHLGIERWVVTGVSWGVTLALAYAQAHPDRVRAMVLAAVTTGSRRETEWITCGMRRFFPVSGTLSPAPSRHPTVAVTCPGHMHACWPARTPGPRSWRLSLGFLTEGQIAAGVGHLGAVPAVLIHGRHDISGPLDTAWDLHQAWPSSRLVVLADSGHGGAEMSVAMTKALDAVRKMH